VADEMRPAALAGTLQYGRLKDVVADHLIALTDPIRAHRAAIVADKKAFKERVIASSEIIRRKAQQTLREVKDLAGLLNVRQ
jgi:tryptophanyl-tRNA synthetase